MTNQPSELSDEELAEAMDAVSRGATDTVRFRALAAPMLAELRRRRREDQATVYTTGTLAKLLGYHENHVRTMCEQGRFPGAYGGGGGRQWRIPDEAVQAFKAACRPKIRWRA
jgi:excisionase family DNA binding protein